MKKLAVLLFFVLVVISLSSNRQGILNVRNFAATTAPGETGRFCGSIGCHFGSNFNTELDLKLYDDNDNEVVEYFPGSEYNVVIKINHTGIPGGHGFQIVSLQDSDDTGTGEFIDLPVNTNSIMNMNRQYVEQSTILATDSIVLKWLAPDAGAGPITFYAAGNSVDGSGGSSNDSGDTTRLQIIEFEPLSTNSLTELGVSIYPNPTADFLYVDSNNQNISAQLFSLNGQQILDCKIDNMNSLINLESGVYIIAVKDRKGNLYTDKLIKL